MSFISFLQSAGGAGSPSSTAGLVSTVVPFILIAAIFYFFIIRPQNKKQKETEKMISALKKGDKIITIGGIHGIVSSAKEKTIIVKVDDGTKIEFSRSAVASVEVDKTDSKDKIKSEKNKKESEENPQQEAETK